jgi:hypothetical protein
MNGVSQSPQATYGSAAPIPSTAAALLGPAPGRRAKSCAAFLPHHLASEIDRILGAELVHDVGAVDFDRSLADAQIYGRFLVGGAGRDQGKNLALAARQKVAAREDRRRDFRTIASPTRATSVSASSRFSMKSNAPFLIASTALGMSPRPEATKIGAG